MEFANKELLRYLRDAVYKSPEASLDVDVLPESLQEFGHAFKHYVESVMEATAFASALSRGMVDEKTPSRGNEIAAPLKSLHASLRHLTWQAKQIAYGDYNQRVEFMGEFADAFNTMVEQLAEREHSLEDKIKQVEEKTASLEQGNLLLSTLVHYIPQQIFVIGRKTRKVLLTNDVALAELEQNADYIDTITRIISEKGDTERNSGIDVEYEYNGAKRYFTINRFFLEWQSEDAEVYAILDASETKKEIADLEAHAYIDSLTDLHNRAYGMMMLDLWLYEKRKFVLVFTDLDSLKYVNDIFGHAEGDIYIIRAGEHLKTFSPDAIVCRVGGDEFLLLAEGYDYDEALSRMNEVAYNLRNDDYQQNKGYIYNMSFGITAVDQNNRMSAGDIMRASDLRMYDNKLRNKQKRKPV